MLNIGWGMGHCFSYMHNCKVLMQRANNTITDCIIGWLGSLLIVRLTDSLTHIMNTFFLSKSDEYLAFIMGKKQAQKNEAKLSWDQIEVE